MIFHKNNYHFYFLFAFTYKIQYHSEQRVIIMDQQQIERSIVKRFRKEIWARFVRGVNTYEMIQPNDKIAVCISGGKDSMLLAKCMQELKKHGKIPFELEFISMNPGYNQANYDRIIENSKNLGIPLHIFNTPIFEIVEAQTESPCYLCARMRRGYLYAKAKELECNKIALGHHFDDVIETILMSMLYGAQIKTMMPKLHSDNFEGMELIRPLYLVKEADILHWCRYCDLTFIACACRFTENLEAHQDNISSKRAEMKELIKKFRETNPYIDINIFRSVENVNLNTLIGYQKDGHHVNFLDNYKKEPIKE